MCLDGKSTLIYCLNFVLPEVKARISRKGNKKGKHISVSEKPVVPINSENMFFLSKDERHFRMNLRGVFEDLHFASFPLQNNFVYKIMAQALSLIMDQTDRRPNLLHLDFSESFIFLPAVSIIFLLFCIPSNTRFILP